jgi:Bacterial regulatory helix-turn-helix protein, lysR family
MNIPESNHNRADLESPVTWTQIERKSPPKALPRLSFQVMRSKNFSLARTRRFADAAKMLGVNATTVARRIARVEELLGVRLFEHNAVF